MLLNEAGDAVFNLDSSDIQQVVQRKERDTSTNTATNVTVHAGYDLYTRNSAGDVQRFSFGEDGRLQGSPTSLGGCIYCRKRLQLALTSQVESA